MSEIKALDKLRCHYNVAGYADLQRCCEKIEAEIADNYMRLPMDITGKPIHVGDVINWCGSTFDVSGISEECIWFEPRNSAQIWKCVFGKVCHHVKPRTLEDVIEGAINAAFGNEASFSDIAKKSADEIREMLGIPLGGNAE